MQVQHPFLYISLPLFCTTKTWNFLVTHFLRRNCCMTLCCSWSLPVFFTAAHCRSLLGASISHFSHRRYQIFVFFFQRNSGISLFIIAGSSCFSVIYVIVSSKITSKKTRLCCWFLLSKRTVGHAISRQKHLEFMWCGQTDGLTVTWLPKLLGWMDYQIFLGTGQRSRALRVERLVQCTDTRKKSNVVKYAPKKQKLVSRKRTKKDVSLNHFTT